MEVNPLDQIIYALTHIQDLVLPLFNWLGPWSYVVLFVLIFMETGLVVFPWLPGESLVFVTSALAAVAGSHLNIFALILVFFSAAFMGDTVNYHIGNFLLRWPFFQRHFAGHNLKRAEIFFQRHGIKAVVFGRFVPLVRTFVPLVAGTSKFKQNRFMLANLLGVALWVTVGSTLGYFFGTIPFVQSHLSLIILGIALVAIAPAMTIWLFKVIRRHIISRNLL
nr:VTT domain-containing protein [Paucilactobacillus wasatchensis]